MKRLIIAVTLFFALPIVSFAVDGTYLIPSWQEPTPSASYAFVDHVVIKGTWQLPPGWNGNIYVYEDSVIDPVTGAVNVLGTKKTDVNTGATYYSVTNAGNATPASGSFSFDIGAQPNGTHNVILGFVGGEECAVNTQLNSQIPLPIGAPFSPTCPITEENLAPNIFWLPRTFTVQLPPYPRMVITQAADPLNYLVTFGTKQTQKYFISNTGGQQLTGTISGLSVPFSCGTTCAYTVNPGAAPFEVNVEFAPQVAQTQYDQTINFSCKGTGGTNNGCDGGANGSIAYQQRNVSGNSTLNAIVPKIEITPTKIDYSSLYGTLFIGVGVSDQKITVKNTGGGILIGSVSFDDPAYSCSGPCNYAVFANASADIYIHYIPTVLGAHEDKATFTGGASPLKLEMKSNVSDKPVIKVGTTLLDFYAQNGNKKVNVGSCLSLSTWVQNIGGGLLSGAVTQIPTAVVANDPVANPGFSCVSGCTYANLSNLQWQAFTIQYCPTVNGLETDTARLTNTTNNPNKVNISLTGRGNTQPVPSMSIGSTITFGPTLINTTKDVSFDLVNGGPASSKINGTIPALPNGYTCVSANCSSSYSISGGSSVTFTFRFAPTAVQNYPGSIVLPGFGTLNFSGSGVQPDFQMSYSGSPLTMCPGTTCVTEIPQTPSRGNYDVGVTTFGGSPLIQNRTFYLYLMNKGSGANVNYSLPSTAHFRCKGGASCAGALGPNGSVNVPYQFEPDAPTIFNEPLVVTYNYSGPNKNVTLNLHGESKSAPYLSVSPSANYPFGDVAINTTKQVTFTVTNEGVGPMDFDADIPTIGAGAPTFGLRRWFKLDSSSGSTAIDTKGNGNGSLSGSYSWTDGKIDGGVSFSSSNDVMLLGSPQGLGSNWTIAAWFTTPLPASGTWHTLTRGWSSDHQIITDGSLNLGTYMNCCGFFSSGYNLGGLSAGWHHLVAVGSGSATAFYIDGVYVGANGVKSTSDVYAIGNYQGGGQKFANKIDDVRIYNRALSASEISDLYGEGIALDLSAFVCKSGCHVTGLLPSPLASQPVVFEFTPTAATGYVAYPRFTSTNGGGIVGYPISAAPYPSMTGNGVYEPIIDVSPLSVGFPDTNQGLYSRQTITTTNMGLGNLSVSVSPIKAAGLDFYCVIRCNFNISPGVSNSTTTVIEFAPNGTGPLNSNIKLSSNGVNVNAVTGIKGEQNVYVYGTSIFAPIIDVRGGDMNYGPVVIGRYKDRTFKISNTGSVDLGSGHLVVLSPGSEFSCISPLDNTGKCAYTINGNGFVEVIVRFTPTSVGPKNGTIYLDGVPLARFFVSGRGVSPSVKFIEQ